MNFKLEQLTSPLLDKVQSWEIKVSEEHISRLLTPCSVFTFSCIILAQMQLDLFPLLLELSLASGV